MNRLWRSTFGLAAVVSLLFTVTVLIVGVLVNEITHEALEQQLDHRVALEADTLLRRDGPASSQAIAALVRARSASGTRPDFGYIVVDAAGTRIAGQLQTRMPANDGFFELTTTGDERRVVQAQISRITDGGRLLVAADRDAINATDATLWHLFLAAFALMLVLGVAAAATVGAVTRVRLRRLDQAARAIIAGDMSRRMPVDGSNSEFDRLSNTLNEMLDRIGALLGNLRQVSSDIAHDLRTPLTRLQHRLESAGQSTDTAQQQADIQAASAQARELQEIFTAMLRISEIEALGVRKHFAEFDISAITTAMVDTYEPEMEAHGIGLSVDITPGLLCHGDRRLWQQLLANLFDNLLRYTPNGTSACLSLQSGTPHNEIRLAIRDDGPGVLHDELPTLFQRFKRSENSRSSPGHGLGLALVKAIARAHSGTVSARLADPGLAITVRLPAPSEAPLHSMF